MRKLLMFVKHRNLIYRVMLLILILIPFIFYEEFYIHTYSHFMGMLLPYTITQQWHIVILNIVLFMSFLIPLSFRRRINWKEYGLVTAFFVSLFVEMYGIPLTIYFASGYFSGSNGEMPNSIVTFNFLGVDISMSVAMTYGLVLMLIGMCLIIIGWVTLYRNLEENAIVTSGIYSISRHPQYFGFILVVVGWLVGWPTILTAIFSPILIYTYLRVCKIEERELSSNTDYQSYKRKVPFFI